VPNPVKTLVQDDGWVHLSLGLAGNISFLCGSILFLPGVSPIERSASGASSPAPASCWLAHSAGSWSSCGRPRPG